jgi:hypothetical protein
VDGTLNPTCQSGTANYARRYSSALFSYRGYASRIWPQAVGLPHVRFLQDKLWEMRIKGRDGIARAIYVADKGRQLMVLHVFTEKTEKTPQRAIQTATERLRRIKSD